MELGYTSIKDFEVKDDIGSGSSGKVKLAYRNGFYYAIKLIGLWRFKDQQKGLFMQEYNINSRLKHKNIVRCYDTFKTEEDLCLVLEFCNDGTLTNYLKSHCITEPEAICILKQVCQGYVYLYENNIIHRDIKPDNILFSIENNVQVAKIGDFGVSKLMRSDIVMSNQATNSYNGSGLYMPPEKLDSLEYTYKSDIYSIGVMYYYMLFKCYPFIGETDFILLNDIKKGVISFNTLNMKVSKHSIDFITQCLQYDPEQRIKAKDLLKHPLFIEPFPLPLMDYFQGVIHPTSNNYVK